MDDGIDIEEHDVLDNPAIKNMFPDLSVIKKEIQQYYEDVSDILQDNEGKIKSGVHEQFIVDKVNTSQDIKEDMKIKAELIESDTIGTISIKEDFDSIGDTDNDITMSNVQFYTNKIILGSKPSNMNSHVVDEYEMFFEKQLTTIQPKVLVEDMQPYLERSGRYCMDCAVLFPNIIALDFHNKTTHLFSIKQEGGKNTTIIKRLKKTFVGMDFVKCKICKNTFSTRQNLTRHVKNVHYKPYSKINVPFKSNKQFNLKCNLCTATFANQSNLLRHVKAKHKVSLSISSSRNVDIKYKRKIVRKTLRKVTVKQSESDKINKMIKTVRNKMQTTCEQSPIEDNNICFHCSTKFKSPQSLIEHLYQVLQSKIPEKGQKTTSNLPKDARKHRITDIVDNAKIETCKNNSVSKKCLYYRCHVCSYYFKDTMNYVAHLAKNHKITTHIKLNNIPFESKCKYCQKIMNDISTYNSHLIQMHGVYYKSVKETDDENTTSAENDKRYKKRSLKIDSDLESVSEISSVKPSYINSVLLKSRIFKCNKCDIYFLSAGMTMDHSYHMELLVNWKCSKCNRIFKKKDENLHEMQHLYSETFDVLDLPDTSLRRLLYGCPKCTVHFNEKNFIKHYPTCGTEAPNSTYCKFCDILIDDTIGKAHKLSHQYENLKSTDFPVIVTDLIECNPNKHSECTKQTLNDVKTCKNKSRSQYENLKTKECSVLVTKNIIELKQNEQDEALSQKSYGLSSKHTDDKKGDFKALQKSFSLKRKHTDDKKGDLKTAKKKPKFNHTVMFDLTYCPTCKCYLTDSYMRNVHLQGNCGHLSRHICKFCGLVITMGSYRGHKGLHNQFKNLKLQDFRFYELKSGKRISPLIPEFPKCINCEVRFVSKMASLNHDCCGEDYLTCHICDLKLSEAAFKLHVLFHNYLNDTIKQTMESTTNSKLKIDTKKIDAYLQSSSQKMQKHPKHTSFVKSEKRNVKNNSNETKATVSKMIVDKISYDAEKNCVKKQSRVNSMQKSNEIKHGDHAINISQRAVHALCQSADSTTDLIKESIDMTSMALLFTCMNCGVSVGSYDRAVEHCQQHFIQKEWDLEFGLCPICNFKLDKQCLTTHQKLHNVFKYGDTNFFKELKFDSFYITTKCEVWIKHIFGSLQQREIDKILANSIYKYEYKIKMEIIQDGPPDLTVYKCGNCRCFIDETSLSRHAENACFKLRRHPCTFCGLAFISSLARIEHEKIHKRPNISAKSYRIVTFNCEKDKTLNSALSCTQYVLYQCRNCNVIVDKSQKRDHKCSHNDRQKCLDCGLLVNIHEYNLHQTRHKELNLFTEYMKIIMFGDKTDDTPDFDELIPTYDGDIYDYTFYKCAKCHICVKNIQLKHVCSFGSSRTKCACCGLFFMTGKFKYHRKFHEIDPDFTQDNMRIIIFNTESQEIPSLSTSQMPPSNSTNNVREMNDLKMDKLSGSKTYIAESVEKEPKTAELNEEKRTADIYKCSCGLCYLDKTSALSHYNSCNPKIRAAIQRCSKCDLVFSPNVLFQHLLAHHGVKNIVYNFNVINVNKQNDTSPE